MLGLFAPFESYSIQFSTYCEVDAIDETKEIQDDFLFMEYQTRDPLVHKYRILGDCELKDKNYEDAVDYYEKALDEYPDTPVILQNKIYALFVLERYSEAMVDCNRLESLDIDPWMWSSCKTQLLLKLEEYDDAYLRIFPLDYAEDDNFYSFQLAGDYHTGVGEYTEAISMYDEAISRYKLWQEGIEYRNVLPSPDSSIDSTLAYLHTKKANAIMELGHPDEAINEYTVALEYSPDKYEPLLGKGNAYFAVKNFNEAEIYFNRSLDVKPGDETAQSRLDLTVTQQIGQQVGTIEQDVDILTVITIIGSIASAISLIWIIKRRNQHHEILKKIDEIPSKINKNTAI